MFKPCVECYFQANLKRYANQTYDRIAGPKVLAETKKPVREHETIDLDGIAIPGARVDNRQVRNTPS